MKISGESLETKPLNPTSWKKLIVLKKVWITDNEETGKSMRKARENSGLSLRGLAARAGISPAYLSDLENGNRKWTDEKVQIISFWMEK